MFFLGAKLLDGFFSSSSRVLNSTKAEPSNLLGSSVVPRILSLPACVPSTDDLWQLGGAK